MYKINDLPYDYDALEPFIDTHTLGLHYNKHQKNYLKKLNELLIKNDYNFNYSIEELPKYVSMFNDDDIENILFNLGGVINHNLYFDSISPKKEEPNILLKNKINNNFGSYDNFKKLFKESALSLKGSGYTFLVLNNGNLKIVNLPNQENPYSYNLIPLITLDLWEHAYYINYENKKDLYIDNFFEIINFHSANKIIEKKNI